MVWQPQLLKDEGGVLGKGWDLHPHDEINEDWDIPGPG